MDSSIDKRNTMEQKRSNGKKNYSSFNCFGENVLYALKNMAISPKK